METDHGHLAPIPMMQTTPRPYPLTFEDDAMPVHRFTNTTAVTVTPYTDIVLPQPLPLEDFDSTRFHP